jgi:hypothetical protein
VYLSVCKWQKYFGCCNIARPRRFAVNGQNGAVDQERRFSMRRNNLPVELLFLMVFVVICIQDCAQALEVKAEKSWQARRELSDAATRRRKKFIYYEEKVPAYIVPEPLVMADGTKVAGAEMWRMRRRPEILELFRKYVYGRAPLGQPKGMTFKVFDLDRKALNGLATRKQVTVNFAGKEDGPSMDILIYLPSAAKKPVPTFVILNFGGNHTIHPDPAIKLSMRWMRGGRQATEQSRGSSFPSYPVEKILARGYGLATIYYGDIDPDYHDGFQNGVHPVFDKLIDGKRAPDAWGSICAWAWGLSRAMDYFESDEKIDESQVAVLGHSRLGKTALWAGARDERFALVISNNSGCGGAALSRRCFGETVKQINNSFPHWFCGNFKKYNGKEDQLPVDQHMLIALMAPRPVYVASADEDLWADPRGEFLACKNAESVYDFLGLKGLEVEKMPALNSPIQKGRIGYHIRSGGHGLTEYDWQQYMGFADRHFKGAKPPLRDGKDIVFYCDFESDKWYEQFGMRSRPERVEIVSSDSARKFEPLAGRAMRIKVDRGGHYGTSIMCRFKDQIGEEPQEIYFRYYLRLADDWNPVGGGKLPGISGTYGRAGWGGRPSDGRNGWSARGLFRRQLGGKTPIGYYCYHADMKGRYGSDWIWDTEKRGYLENNRWYCIEQYVKMNTPGKNDGILRGWVDGQPAFEKTDVRMRDVDTLRIEAVWLNVYLGGSWVAKSDHHLYIDDVVIANHYVGPIQ